MTKFGWAAFTWECSLGLFEGCLSGTDTTGESPFDLQVFPASGYWDGMVRVRTSLLNHEVTVMIKRSVL